MSMGRYASLVVGGPLDSEAVAVFQGLNLIGVAMAVISVLPVMTTPFMVMMAAPLLGLTVLPLASEVVLMIMMVVRVPIPLVGQRVTILYVPAVEAKKSRMPVVVLMTVRALQ
jgi:hypothetical protein